MAAVAAGEAAFPTGLKVMVVDDDPLCLKVIEKMLLVCKYEGTVACDCMQPGCLLSAALDMFHHPVTTCQSSTQALEMLRDHARHFDLVLSDVYMPGTLSCEVNTRQLANIAIRRHGRL